MHIVSLKKGLTVDQATADSEGIAVLGFFINVCVHNYYPKEKSYNGYTFNKHYVLKMSIFGRISAWSWEIGCTYEIGFAHSPRFLHLDITGHALAL